MGRGWIVTELGAMAMGQEILWPPEHGEILALRTPAVGHPESKWSARPHEPAIAPRTGPDPARAGQVGGHPRDTYVPYITVVGRANQTGGYGSCGIVRAGKKPERA